MTVLEQTTERRKCDSAVLYKCKCDCGNIELVAGTELRANKKFRCKECNLSGGVIIIKNILNKNNINYQTEYTFANCKNPITNHHLKFDFYLSDYNTLIEFDGE